MTPKELAEEEPNDPERRAKIYRLTEEFRKKAQEAETYATSYSALPEDLGQHSASFEKGVAVAMRTAAQMVEENLL